MTTEIKVGAKVAGYTGFGTNHPLIFKGNVKEIVDFGHGKNRWKEASVEVDDYLEARVNRYEHCSYLYLDPKKKPIVIANVEQLSTWTCSFPNHPGWTMAKGIMMTTQALYDQFAGEWSPERKGLLWYLSGLLCYYLGFRWAANTGVTRNFPYKEREASQKEAE